MIGQLRIAILLIAMTTSLLAQDRAVIRIGPALGYRSVAADFTADVAPGQATVRSASALVPSYALAVGLQYPVASFIDLSGDVEVLWNAGIAADRFTVPIVVDQQQQSATIRRDHDLRQTIVLPSLGVTLHADQRTHLTLAATLAIPVEQQLAASDAFESPSTGTFVSTGTATRTLQNAAFANGPLVSYGALAVRAAREVPLSGRLSIAPFLRGRVAITSALQNGSWYPWEIGAGIDLCVDLSPAAATDPVPSAPESAPVIVRRNLIDTVTVVDIYDPERTDTLWTRTERIRDSVVQGALADTVIVMTIARVVRHLPGPPPFLSVILDVETEDQVADSVAALRVGVECVSDTTTTTKVSIHLDQDVIWNETFTGARFKRTVILSNIVPALDERDRLDLRIRAITMDAVGQTLEAVPRNVALRRTSSGRTLVREP